MFPVMASLGHPSVLMSGHPAKSRSIIAPLFAVHGVLRFVAFSKVYKPIVLPILVYVVNQLGPVAMLHGPHHTMRPILFVEDGRRTIPLSINRPERLGICVARIPNFTRLFWCVRFHLKKVRRSRLPSQRPRIKTYGQKVVELFRMYHCSNIHQQNGNANAKSN